MAEPFATLQPARDLKIAALRQAVEASSANEQAALEKLAKHADAGTGGSIFHAFCSVDSVRDLRMNEKERRPPNWAPSPDPASAMRSVAKYVLQAEYAKHLSERKDKSSPPVAARTRAKVAAATNFIPTCAHAMPTMSAGGSPPAPAAAEAPPAVAARAAKRVVAVTARAASAVAKPAENSDPQQKKVGSPGLSPQYSSWARSLELWIYRHTCCYASP